MNHPKQKLLLAYNALYKRNNELCRNMAKRVHIPETTLWILYYLRYDAIITQKDLCDVSFQPKQTVNSALKKLDAEGYIDWSVTESNKKNKVVTLTEKGEKLAQQTADKILAAEERVFCCMSDTEIEQLMILYDKYLTTLEMEIEHI